MPEYNPKIKYDETKSYILNPLRRKWVEENMNVWAMPDSHDIEDSTVLQKQLLDLMDLSIPVAIVNEIWRDFSHSYDGSMLALYDDSIRNIQAILNCTEGEPWIIEGEDEYQ